MKIQRTEDLPSFRSPQEIQKNVQRDTFADVKMKLILLLLLLVGSAICAPWFDLWFPSYGSRNSGYNANGRNQQYREGRGGGKERWKQICRTVNPDPYAFAGRAPYPAAPVCPW